MRISDWSSDVCSSDLDDRVVDLVGEGYDLAIRIAELPPSTLIARRLAVSRRMVCAAPAYLERAGRPQRPEDPSRHARSEERRGGQECVSTCSTRWPP